MKEGLIVKGQQSHNKSFSKLREDNSEDPATQNVFYNSGKLKSSSID